MDHAWEVLLWSFAALLRGLWPARDWQDVPLTGWRADKANTPLCGPWRFVLWQVAADLDYCCNYFRLRHFNTNTPCFKCGCNRSSIPWSDVSDSASWRNTVVTAVDWHLQADKHRLLNTPSVGVTMFNVVLDAMHILDLGTVQLICGGAIHMLAFDADLGGGLPERIGKAWGLLLQAYTALGTPAGERLTLAHLEHMFENNRSWRPTDFPNLKAKAAIARHAVAALSLVYDGL